MKPKPFFLPNEFEPPDKAEEDTAWAQRTPALQENRTRVVFLLKGSCDND